MPSPQSLMVAKAMAFAAEAHKTQFRAQGVPYFCHVFEVYKLVRNRTGDADVQVAALLHDTIEDCQVSRATLAAEFNERIAELVQQLTNDYSDHLEHEQKLVATREHASHLSEDAKLVKMYDRYHNLSECEAWKPQRIMRYCENTRALFDAMAMPLNPPEDKKFGHRWWFEVSQVEILVSGLEKKFKNWT